MTRLITGALRAFGTEGIVIVPYDPAAIPRALREPLVPAPFGIVRWFKKRGARFAEQRYGNHRRIAVAIEFSCHAASLRIYALSHGLANRWIVSPGGGLPELPWGLVLQIIVRI